MSFVTKKVKKFEIETDFRSLILSKRERETVVEQNIQMLINGLSDHISQGTAWEQSFYASVKTQFEQRHTLSHRQLELLNKIAANYSPKALKQRAEWKLSWDSNKKEIATVCARYYHETGYYGSIAGRVLEDPDFIPSFKQYKAMCENKYAEKVLEAHFKEPSYKVGSLVSLRDRAFSLLRSKLTNDSTMVMVLRTDLPITSAAKGCKRYEVVQVGASLPLEVEERDLKKIKGAKCTAKTTG
jgi:hypothetical protein